MSRTNDDHVTVRMPRELVTRLDAYVEGLREGNPGIVISRSDVVRLLVHRGLDALPSISPQASA